MKIAKALKEKNKLKKEIGELKKRIERNNSVVKGNNPSYRVDDLLAELNEKVSELIKVKTTITEANYPVQGKIYRMAELKGLIQFYRSVPVIDGKREPGYGEILIEYEVQVRDKIFDELIKKAEEEMEVIQEELDVFNQLTELL